MRGHRRQFKKSLQRFALDALAPFTEEGTFASNASRDFPLFHVGGDDVLGILKYLLSRATSGSGLAHLVGALAECKRWCLQRTQSGAEPLTGGQWSGYPEMHRGRRFGANM
jgi:hypothetical protein